MLNTIIAATLIVFTPIAGLATERQPTTAEAAIMVADGNPWTMVARDGKRVSLTLTPDGRGRLAGPITVSIKWRVERDKFCLHMGFMLGTRCVDLAAIPHGWRGTGAKGDSFTLTRS